MDWTFLCVFTVVLVGVMVLYWHAMGWVRKKAGIKPMDYHEKLFYDNFTCLRDSRTHPKHRSYHYSRKGGTLSIEMTHTRGSMVLEFYTEDGQVLQTWRNGDPKVFTVDIPPRVRVYWRADMVHFSGSICFR